MVGVPLERVAIDIMRPLPKCNKGNLYILVMGDYFTKWVDGVPIRYQKASTVTQKLIERIISIFGAPMQILSDQGRSYESDIFREICKIFGIEKTRTTPIDPNQMDKSNGQIEQLRTCKHLLYPRINKNRIPGSPSVKQYTNILYMKWMFQN